MRNRLFSQKNCRQFLGHFGSFLGHFGPFWAILGLLGPFWAIFGPFWVIFGPLWAIFMPNCGKFNFFCVIVGVAILSFRMYASPFGHHQWVQRIAGKVFVDDQVFHVSARQPCMFPPVSQRALPSIVHLGTTPQIGGTPQAGQFCQIADPANQPGLDWESIQMKPSSCPKTLSLTFS